MIIMKSLDECHTIEEVADQVNDWLDNDEPESAERMADKYALEAAEEAGYGTDDETIDAHRQFLRDAGSKI